MPAAYQGQDLFFLFELRLKSLSVIHLVSHSFIAVITIVSKQKDSGTKICKGIFRFALPRINYKTDLSVTKETNTERALVKANSY